MQCDSDLAGRLVTRGVGPLHPGEIDAALAAGRASAEALVARGLIHAAALHLHGQTLATTRPPCIHHLRHAEERRHAARLEARPDDGACFEMAGSAGFLSMTPSGNVPEPSITGREAA